MMIHLHPQVFGGGSDLGGYGDTIRVWGGRYHDECSQIPQALV